MPPLFRQITPLRTQRLPTCLFWEPKEQSEKTNKTLYDCCQIDNDATQR